MFDHIPLVLAQEGDTFESETRPNTGDMPAIGEQTSELPPNGDPPGRSSSSSNPLTSFLPLILIVGIFMFIMMGGQRREKKKHAKMLAALAKGDRVVTVGGMIGTVIEVRDHELVVKVDENSNTRVKFTREAVKTVLQDQKD